MNSRLKILIACMALTVTAFAQPVTYQREDSVKICKLLQAANKETTSLWFARQFLGVPYVAHTLEVNDNEQLVVNTRQLDCTTLVETVSALTICASHGKKAWGDYLSTLRLLRYRQGKLDGYASRLHYFSDWIRDKQEMKMVTVELKHIYRQSDASFIELLAKVRTNTMDDGAYAWGSYVYKADEKGNLHRLYYASTVCDFDKNIISSDTTFYQ